MPPATPQVWRISTAVRVATAAFGSVFSGSLLVGYFFMGGHVIGLILGLTIAGAVWLGAFRPKLEIVGDRVKAQNPIGSFELAAHEITSITPTYEGIEFLTTEGKYKTARAVQKSNIGALFGNHTRSHDVVTQLRTSLRLE